MRIIRISLLWMEDDDSNWKFSDRFSWLMRGTGWCQFVAERLHIEIVLIADEVQKFYRLDSENAGPHHEGKEFWNTFKDIQQYSRLYIVAFASYGYHGAYDYSPNSDGVMKISPFQLSEHNTWGLKEIRFTSEEYNGYATNFSRSKLNLSSQQDEDNLLNYIRQCTLCHPGLGTRAALGLKNMDKDETYLCDTVLFNRTGIPICLETVPNYGCLYKTNLLSIVASGPNDKFLGFAAPLLRAAYLQTRVGSTNHSTKTPETFRDFLKLTFVNMNPETLCKSLGVGSDGHLLERVFQMEFYRSATYVLPQDVFISVDVGAVFGNDGYVDFYIDDKKDWAIELLCDKFNQNFNKVVMNFPDGEKTEMSLGGSGILTKIGYC
ncbi:20605_t:CDS:2 [Entrophospora sp. SA101]|nr:20605_t:CDS:2 [Entrophospora sp. SA101]